MSSLNSTEFVSMEVLGMYTHTLHRVRLNGSKHLAFSKMQQHWKLLTDILPGLSNVPNSDNFVSK